LWDKAVALQGTLAAIEARQHAQHLNAVQTSPEPVPALVELTRACQHEYATEEARLARLATLRIAQRQAELDAAFLEQVAAFKATAPSRHTRLSVEDLFAPRSTVETVVLSPTADETTSLDLFLAAESVNAGSNA
jgi:hypothetical protein